MRPCWGWSLWDLSLRDRSLLGLGLGRLVLEELVPAVEALQQALGVPERILKLHFVEFEDCSHSHLAERQLLFPGR